MTSGKAFTIRKPITETHLVSQTAALSHAELTQPSCPSCFRPGKEQGYCAKCETKPDDGSDSPADRHRKPRQPCATKIRFEHETGAHKQSAKMDAKGRGYTRVYQCPDCDGWHLTSMRHWAPPKLAMG